MITKVEVRTLLGLLLTLELDDVSDGLVLQDIQGLDPVKATLASSPYATRAGALYQSSRREPRNIIMTLGLEPDYVTTTVYDLRTRLYDFFMPDAQVDLRLYDSTGLTVNISGRVESFQAPLFTQEPQASISIMCFDPDFSVLTPITGSHNTVSDSTEFLLTYNGSIPVGIVVAISVNRTVGQFTVYHRAPDGVTRSFDLSASMLSGDLVTIDTIDGEKKVILRRSGTDSSLLYGMAVQSDWIKLRKGANYLRIHATGAAIPYTLSYTPRYGGL